MVGKILEDAYKAYSLGLYKQLVCVLHQGSFIF